MEKIELGTPDGAAENIDRLAELFPQVITEVENPAGGGIRKTVDFDALRDLLGDVAEGQRERYQFTWPGKREAKAEARRPIYKTMIPELGKSKDWDTTENLYIEGDNLDALKILKETYAGKVKLIYIDPPYNTGHDSFVYPDSFRLGTSDYEGLSDEWDNGCQMVANTEGYGKFHSVWCSMIYQRLILAKDYLSSDGLIFISIDENELMNLIKICDEVFGASRRVGIFKWNKTSKAPTLSKFIRNKYEYILAYRSSDCKGLRGPDSYNTAAPLFNSGNGHSRVVIPQGAIDCNFPDGTYCSGQYGDGEKHVILHNDFVVKNGVNANDVDITGRFKWSQETLNERIAEGQRLLFKNARFVTLYYYLDSEGKFIAPSDILNKDECGVLRNDEAFNEVKDLFGFPLFEYTKPTSLIKYLIRMIPDDCFTVFDFFSGSGTTAQAVFELNQENGGKRNSILVQIPDKCPDGSNAAENGFRTICEIGEERIRRAGAKIAADIDKENEQLQLGADPKSYPDLGFRVLRIDSSNFKDFYLTPGETSQESLFDFADNVKEGRSDLDLLFEVLPKLGIPYSAKIEERILAGKKVFFVDGDKLAACFDANVGSDTIEEMAKAKPWYAVIRDSSMADDATHANYEELFRTYSPDTVAQVI